MKIGSLKKVVAATLLIAASASQVEAQGIPNFFKRMELGYTYSFASAKYKATEVATTSSGKSFETSISENVKSNFSFGGVLGSYIPLKKMGRGSLLAIGVGAVYNAYTWDYKIPTFQYFITNSNNEEIGAYYDYDNLGLGVSSMSVQIGMPISLDVKFGAEANLQRGSRFTGTIGAGALPSVAMTADFGNGGFGFGVSPFVKGEIGIKGGILWKIRAQYAFGRIPFYEEGKSVNSMVGFSNKSELIGNSVLSFSLVLMPFSWNFSEDGWWNDHH